LGTTFSQMHSLHGLPRSMSFFLPDASVVPAGEAAAPASSAQNFEDWGREKRFRSFVENANDIIYTLDPQGRFTYITPNVQTILGWVPDAMVGQDFREIIHPADLPGCQAAFAALLQGQRLTGVEYRARKGDGSWSWQSSNLSPMLDDDGQVTEVIGVGRDIHLRRQAEEKLRLSEERYRLLSDNARDVIWTIAPDGRITYVSPSVEQVRGYTPQEAMQQPLEQILAPASVAQNLAYFGGLLADLAAGRPPQPFRGQMEYLCKDGSTYWCDVIATPILAEDGSLVELLGVSRDISDHKRFERELQQAKAATESLNQALAAANAELSRLATTDALTGLWNRRYFEAQTLREMAKAQRYGHPLSMLLVDIDHFKRVNDVYGHLAGDRVLVTFSQVLQ
jgi:PAS domain S-box-containing protein